MEILTFSTVGQAKFESSGTAKFVDKCTSSEDVFFSERPEGGQINIFHCPVIKKDVRYSGTVCVGPVDKSACEHNRFT